MVRSAGRGDWQLATDKGRPFNDLMNQWPNGSMNQYICGPGDKEQHTNVAVYVKERSIHPGQV